MRIGLITIFNVPNYGAILQCYALTRYLKEQGHDVFLYYVDFSTTNKNLHYAKQKLMLSDFNNFIKENIPEYTTNLSRKADCYMVGSDQVWNPEILGKMTEKYMLSFVPKREKKVAYAASFGTSSWNNEKLYGRAKELLGEFRYITVRENSGVNLLKDQFGLTAYQVLDPCFLIKDYSSLFKGMTVAEKNTLVTFKLVYSYEWYCQAKGLARSLGCKWIELKGRYLKKQGDIHGLNVKSVSIRKWLLSIATSKYVVTDSFHGTVFCILFKRQFAVLPAIKSRSTRLASLLSALGLEQRMANSVDDCEKLLQQEINYEDVYLRLEKLRNSSVSHLNKMLQL